MALMSSKIPTKKMVPLCRQLATSYEAGIPIVRTLSLIGDQMGDPQSRQVLRAMSDHVQGGGSLGEAARLQERHLPPFFIELLASGETGGKLDAMLRELAQYYEDRMAMIRRVAGSLVLPFLQLCAAWFLGTFALGIIGKIDYNSTTAFSLQRYFSKYLLFQGKALLILGAIVVVCVVLSRMGLFRWVWGFVANFAWPISVITRKLGLSRFFRSMSLLISSGMNIKGCIANSAAMTANPYLQKDLLRALPHVAQGATLVQAFSACRMLTPVAREMIRVGEESGKLEESLRKVAEYHLEESTHAIQVATKLLGVLVVLAVGGIVGYIVISFYSGLYGGMLDAI